MQPRDHQIIDIIALQSALKRYKSVLYQLSTGGGKTVVACHIIKSALSKGNITWFVVNRRRLISQTSEALTASNIPHGIIAAGQQMDVSQQIQVVMIQTVINRLHLLPHPRLMILDEFHNAKSATYEMVISKLPEARILGLSATPCRLDNKPLNTIVQTMVTGKPLSWLISEGYLCDAKLYAPPVGVEDKTPKKQNGEFAAADIVEIMDKPTVTGCAIEHYQRIAAGQPALVFCASIKHAEHTAQQFRNAGISCESIDSTMTQDTLDKVLDWFKRGQLQVVISVDLVSEGFDLPSIAAAIFLRHTASLRLIIQMIGRALRPVYAEGYDLSNREGRLAAIAASPKPHAIILDHVGNIYRHELQGLGLPAWDIEWTLDGEVKRKREPEPTISITQCVKCSAVHAPAKSCPYCGHSYESKIRAIIEQQEGELAAIKRDELERKNRKTEERMCKTLADWQQIAKERGYKPYWAVLRHNAREGKRC